MDLNTLPKTELHLHLEGAIPAPTLLELIHKYGGATKVSTLSDLRERLSYRDFPHFLDVWRWMTLHVREYDDFRTIARDVARELAAQGVLYAEVFFSPADFARHGLELQRIATAIRTGLDEAGPEPRVRLIVDLCRQYGPELGARWLEETAEVAREADIVGIGLGGPEHEVPPEVYAAVYRRAADLGLRRVAHAGEAASTESIWSAIKTLGAERIGHGTCAVDDPDLVAYLRSTALPVEVCVTSNVRTGVVARPEDHPIRRMFDAGVRVTVSSDDPTFFDTHIVEEYAVLRDALHFSPKELLHVARTGFEVAFVTEDERAGLLGRFDELTRGVVGSGRGR